jgi:hypothetical protein
MGHPMAAYEAHWLAAHYVLLGTGCHLPAQMFDAARALRELTVVPTLLTNWMQLHGWMAAEAQWAAGIRGKSSIVI